GTGTHLRWRQHRRQRQPIARRTAGRRTPDPYLHHRCRRRCPAPGKRLQLLRSAVGPVDRAGRGQPEGNSPPDRWRVLPRPQRQRYAGHLPAARRAGARPARRVAGSAGHRPVPLAAGRRSAAESGPGAADGGEESAMTELLGFTLLRPWWLLALLPAAILLVQLHRHGWQHSDWEQLLPRPLHQWLLRRQAGGSRGLRFAALGLTWTLVIVALAGPAVETGAESRRVDDNALVVVLDLSRNMLANDLPPDRMERARLKIRSLIQDYGDSQLSLIVYAGSAHRVTPLSNDHATLTNLLGALSPDIMPSDGQNLGAALDMARQALAPLPSKGSQMLLVTSGLDNGARDVLAEHARQLGPQLSILGVGTRSGAPVPLSEGGFLRDDQGRILLPRLNSQQLGNLAREHGARYHEITTSD